MSHAAFFDAIRPMFGGKLTASQVQGVEIILTATDGLPVSHRAYLLATAKHETANTMQPIHEMGRRAYFNKYEPGTRIGRALGNTVQGDGYLFRGRGYVQLTGRANYVKAGKKLGMNLVDGPDAALSPMIAARILVQGSSEGWFTGKKLSDYLPDSFVEARRVINGTDKAQEIAAIAIAFGKALALLGDESPKPVAKPVTPKPVDDSIPPKSDPKAFGLAWLVKFIVQGLALLFRRK